MAQACRKLAADLRKEAAAGWGPVPMTGQGWINRMPRVEAARRMDEQAERWESEAAGGPRNVVDRERIGAL